MKLIMKKIQQRLGLAIVALGAVIFFLDLLYPAGVAIGALYTGLLFVTIWSPDRRLPFKVGLACSILIVLGLLLSPASGPPWFAVINRVLTLFSVWVAASLSLLVIHAEEARGRVRVEVEEESGTYVETGLSQEPLIVRTNAASLGNS